MGYPPRAYDDVERAWIALFRQRYADAVTEIATLVRFLEAQPFEKGASLLVLFLQLLHTGKDKQLPVSPLLVKFSDEARHRAHQIIVDRVNSRQLDFMSLLVGQAPITRIAEKILRDMSSLHEVGIEAQCLWFSNFLRAAEERRLLPYPYPIGALPDMDIPAMRETTFFMLDRPELYARTVTIFQSDEINLPQSASLLCDLLDAASTREERENILRVIFATYNRLVRVLVEPDAPATADLGPLAGPIDRDKMS